MGTKFNKCLEKMTVIILITTVWFCFICNTMWPFVIYFCPFSALIIIPYYLWIFYDKRAGSWRNPKSKWWRKMLFWKHLRNYFPVSLIKTAELPEGQNYILAAHHHGLLPLSIVINFASEGNEIGKLFPGIDFRIASRKFVHTVIIREICLALGFVDISKFTITRLLKRDISTGVLLFPGGFNEVSLCNPGSNKFQIYAIKRKGFVKLALETGTSLVPVLIFGDTELLTKKEIKYLPNLFKYIPISMFKDIYVNNYFMHGLMPKKTPLNTIIGEPITIPKVENPSSELVDQYHTQFYEAFKQLFEKYKHDYSPGGSSYELIVT